jgi:hypothetical protein
MKIKMQTVRVRDLKTGDKVMIFGEKSTIENVTLYKDDRFTIQADTLCNHGSHAFDGDEELQKAI